MKSRDQERLSSVSSSSPHDHQDNNSVNKAETVGEELYLVHLRRHEGEEVRPEDFDLLGNTTPNKKRSGSIGEELWHVHMKRSKGMEPDTDTDHDHNEEDESQETRIKDQQDSTAQSPSRYNLRTRRSKSNTSQ